MIFTQESSGDVNMRHYGSDEENELLPNMADILAGAIEAAGIPRPQQCGGGIPPPHPPPPPPPPGSVRLS